MPLQKNLKNVLARQGLSALTQIFTAVSIMATGQLKVAYLAELDNTHTLYYKRMNTAWSNEYCWAGHQTIIRAQFFSDVVKTDWLASDKTATQLETPQHNS